MQWSNHYEWILTMLNVGVHVVDQKGMTVFYNETMADIDGLKREKVLGKSIFALYPSLTMETSTLNLALTKGISTIETMQTYVNNQGKQITTINSTYPLYERDEIIGAVETAKDITRIVRTYDQILEYRKELVESQKKGRTAKGTANYQFSDLIGESPNFLKAMMIAKKAARTLSPVLIYGATGTGKELIAQSIHNASLRYEKPFIAINCAALPKELMEGLLFGTTKGAFTGAIDRPGIIEQANGGTLFLDELNSLDLLLQAKLLRVLQDQKIRRLGGQAEKEMDVRIITAINIQPEKALADKLLRLDLYYRLNVVYIELPPLQQRKSDIPLLVKHFIKQFNQAFGDQLREIEIEALQLLQNYRWPGNIRELRHAIEAAYNMLEYGEQILKKEHLPSYLYNLTPLPELRNTVSVKTDHTLPMMLEKFERETILQVFKEQGGNVSKTAEILGLKRQALQYKLTKYGIKRGQEP